MRAIPPLKALLALESAMRLGSFTLAADELSVTPGAVGQQIQKLEAWLGIALFVRQIRQVTPTAEGRA
ncbi:LysR family transcriptional regulator, partial [Paraburkholderia sp.]|uniref:LysR family transcriptional regulator n=1 Tax=Paraburkholderia sp. TaxID=1926495 RepID=UPI002F3FB052